MFPLRTTLTDYRDAARAFSRPAKLYLVSEFFAWTGHGIFQVLFNLYLVQGGFKESFVGRAVSMAALGLALAALPAGALADRWGRKRCLVLGAVIEGVALILRSVVMVPGPILAASFLGGVGQSLLAIAAAPFLSEHSTARERTHLFSAFFAISLLAGVVGSMLGGVLPGAIAPLLPRMDLLHHYRAVLILGGALVLGASIPLLRLRGVVEAGHARESAPASPAAVRQLAPIALTALLIGAGAGLVIPFMNLYFATRFHCSSGQIGLFFSSAQVLTAGAALLGPAVARRYGKLRTATASQLLSLPFLVTMGAERHLGVAVAAFWARATLMQASTPLVQAFVMEALPATLRARATSINNLVWNIGWALSATLAGLIIQHFGYAVPFYITAVLYAVAASVFYLSFRGHSESRAAVRLSEEAKGQRGEGPFTE